MRNQTSIEVDCSIDEAFDYTTNNVAEWSLIVIEDEPIEVKPEGVGSTFRVVTEENGNRMEFDGLVTLHEPPTAHTVRMVGKQFDIESEYLFEDLCGRTRITQHSTVTGKGMVKVMFFLFGWLMKKSSCKAGEQEFANLKRMIEARESVGQ